MAYPPSKHLDIWKQACRLAASLLLLESLLLASQPAGAAGKTTRVSLDSDGFEVFENNYSPSISADGRYVAFESAGNILVPGDNNWASDVFIRDLQSGKTTRVSVASDGTEADDESYAPVISADGRYVAFESDAGNLVSGDSNGLNDVFIHDRKTGQTKRASVTSGRTQADGYSASPDLSADGRFVAFYSNATILVPGDNNGTDDIFVHDRQTGQTNRVSVASDETEVDGGSYAPTLSADGRFVAFESYATNLVPGDSNSVSDVFIRDLHTGRTSRVSVASDEREGNGSSFAPTLSADGRFVAFQSHATNLVLGDTNGKVDVFIRDRMTGRTSRISVASAGTQANDHSISPNLSADGRYVAFESYATNLALRDTNRKDDVFIHGRNARQTTRISVTSGAKQAGGHSFVSALSADGRFVAFESVADNLVPVDTNEFQDVFVRDRLFDKKTSADLALAATDAPDPAQRGKILTYAFTLTNKGANQATGVTLVDVLSSNLILNSITPSQGSCNKAHVLVCRLGNLAKGKSAKVTVQVTVGSSMPASFSNTASAQANPRDPNPTYNAKLVRTMLDP
jgi:uncharacterized repeat protein (TIGR01451 family)